MKRIEKLLLIFLTVLLVLGGISSGGWAQEKPYDDRLNLADLFIARPLGVIAAAGGTGLFILSLPFTLPTRSVEDSFNMFVVEPWKFSFVRDFPEER
jgi:hypothetical protein